MVDNKDKKMRFDNFFQDNDLASFVHLSIPM